MTTTERARRNQFAAQRRIADRQRRAMVEQRRQVRTKAAR